jgi:hypothetical protein
MRIWFFASVWMILQRTQVPQHYSHFPDNFLKESNDIFLVNLLNLLKVLKDRKSWQNKLSKAEC